jgi:hypothetical protein
VGTSSHGDVKREKQQAEDEKGGDDTSIHRSKKGLRGEERRE